MPPTSRTGTSGSPWTDGHGEVRCFPVCSIAGDPCSGPPSTTVLIAPRAVATPRRLPNTRDDRVELGLCQPSRDDRILTTRSALVSFVPPNNHGIGAGRGHRRLMATDVHPATGIGARQLASDAREDRELARSGPAELDPHTARRAPCRHDRSVDDPEVARHDGRYCLGADCLTRGNRGARARRRRWPSVRRLWSIASRADRQNRDPGERSATTADTCRDHSRDRAVVLTRRLGWLLGRDRRTCPRPSRLV